MSYLHLAGDVNRLIHTKSKLFIEYASFSWKKDAAVGTDTLVPVMQVIRWDRLYLVHKLFLCKPVVLCIHNSYGIHSDATVHRQCYGTSVMNEQLSLCSLHSISCRKSHSLHLSLPLLLPLSPFLPLFSSFPFPFFLSRSFSLPLLSSLLFSLATFCGLFEITKVFKIRWRFFVSFTRNEMHPQASESKQNKRLPYETLSIQGTASDVWGEGEGGGREKVNLLFPDV